MRCDTVRRILSLWLCGLLGSAGGTLFVVRGADRAALNGMYMCPADSSDGCDHLLSDARLFSTFKMISGSLEKQWRLSLEGVNAFVSVGAPLSPPPGTNGSVRASAVYHKWRALPSKELAPGLRMVAVEILPAPCPPLTSQDSWVLLRAHWVKQFGQWQQPRPGQTEDLYSIDALPEVLADVWRCALHASVGAEMGRVRAAAAVRTGQDSRGKPAFSKTNNVDDGNSGDSVLDDRIYNSYGVPLHPVNGPATVGTRLREHHRFVESASRALASFTPNDDSDAVGLHYHHCRDVLASLARVFELLIGLEGDAPSPGELWTEGVAAFRTDTLFAQEQTLPRDRISQPPDAQPPQVASGSKIVRSRLSCFGAPMWAEVEFHAANAGHNDSQIADSTPQHSETVYAQSILNLESCLRTQLLIDRARSALVKSVDPQRALELTSELFSQLVLPTAGQTVCGEEIVSRGQHHRVAEALAVHAVAAVLSGMEQTSLLPSGPVRRLLNSQGDSSDTTVGHQTQPVVVRAVIDACPMLLRGGGSLDDVVLSRTCASVRTLLVGGRVAEQRWPILPFEEGRALSASLLTAGAPLAAVDRAVSSLKEVNDDESNLNMANASNSCPESSYLKAMSRLLSNVPYRAPSFLASSRRLSLFLSTMLELASPIVLYEGCWAAETLSLRALANQTLWELYDMCSEEDASCASVIDDPAYATSSTITGYRESANGLSDAGLTVHAAVGTRGLFLLAYQGANLILSDVEGEDGHIPDRPVKDNEIPRAYFRLLWTLGYRSSGAAQPGVEPFARPITRSPSVGIRVGFLSAFFYEHSIGRLFQFILVGLREKHGCVIDDSSKDKCLHITLFHLQPSGSKHVGGPVQQSLESSAHDVVVVPYHVGKAASALYASSLDVLVFTDLYMDPVATAVASFRSAPVQAVFWGHPFTSGQETIDYFISSVDYEPVFDRPAAQKGRRAEQFTEQLVLFESPGAVTGPTESQRALKHSNNKYHRASYMDFSDFGTMREAKSDPLTVVESILATKTRDLFGMPYDPSLHLQHWCARRGVDADDMNQISSGSPWCLPTAEEVVSPVAPKPLAWWFRSYFSARVGCLQMIMKIHPLLDDVIVEILRADARAVVFLLRSTKQPLLQDEMQKRLANRIATAGVNPYGVIFIDEMSKQDYERVVCSMSVTLDPVPFGGGVTLWDSLHCGVPFVTASDIQSVHALGAGIARAAPQRAIASFPRGAISSPPAAVLSLGNSTRVLARCVIYAHQLTRNESWQPPHGCEVIRDYYTFGSCNSDDSEKPKRNHDSRIVCSAGSHGVVEDGDDKSVFDGITRDWFRFLTRIGVS